MKGQEAHTTSPPEGDTKAIGWFWFTVNTKAAYDY